MKKYYSEEVEKDSVYRTDILSGIETFLNNSEQCARKEREHFISPERYKETPEVYRGKFIDMLGFPLREDRILPTVNKNFVTRDDNVDIFRMTFLFKNGLRCYGLYFRQTENYTEKPLIFGLHGGAGTPELISSIHFDSANYNHLVRRLTDKGANVFVPQLLLWQKETYGNEYDRLETDGKLRQLGGSVTALEIYQMQCVLDYFIAKENIAADKTGVAGMSYGGMYAIHLAAADTRIKACYSCSWVCDVFKWVKPDWSYQGAQRSFAVAETAGLIAPRCLVVAMGIEDPAYQKGTDSESERILSYYEVFNKTENFSYIKFQGSHEIDKGEKGLEFLLKALI